MTDRGLLELAAKAAGLIIVDEDDDLTLYVISQHDKKNGDEYGERWAPLEDDGDALRLAAHLKIDIEWQSTNPFPEDTVEAYRRNPEGEFFCAMYPEEDYRRAIVRAAAELGRGME